MVNIMMSIDSILYINYFVHMEIIGNLNLKTLISGNPAKYWIAMHML